MTTHSPPAIFGRQRGALQKSGWVRILSKNLKYELSLATEMVISRQLLFRRHFFSLPVGTCGGEAGASLCAAYGSAARHACAGVGHGVTG